MLGRGKKKSEGEVEEGAGREKERGIEKREKGGGKRVAASFCVISCGKLGFWVVLLAMRCSRGRDKKSNDIRAQDQTTSTKKPKLSLHIV